MVERPSLSEQLEHYERVKEDADLARQCYTEGVEDGKQAAEARIAELEGKLAEAHGAMQEAKLLIGARTDGLTPAQRAESINRAWWMLDNALASGGTEAAAVLEAAADCWNGAIAGPDDPMVEIPQPIYGKLAKAVSALLAKRGRT